MLHIGGSTLFEEGYNDRILMRDGQLENWRAYLRSNPYRWLVRHQCPELMQRSLCIEIEGIRYGAFGNFMLLSPTCSSTCSGLTTRPNTSCLLCATPFSCEASCESAGLFSSENGR